MVQGNREVVVGGFDGLHIWNSSLQRHLSIEKTRLFRVYRDYNTQLCEDDNKSF